MGRDTERGFWFALDDWVRGLIGRVLAYAPQLFGLLLLLGLAAFVDREGVSNREAVMTIVAMLVGWAVLLRLRLMVLSKYVTGKWGVRALRNFYALDRANRSYEPREQKRLYEESIF